MWLLKHRFVLEEEKKKEKQETPYKHPTPGIEFVQTKITLDFVHLWVTSKVTLF